MAKPPQLEEIARIATLLRGLLAVRTGNDDQPFQPPILKFISGKTIPRGALQLGPIQKHETDEQLRSRFAAAFAQISATWGGVDIVIVNAGLALASPLVEMDLEAFRKLERVNVEGTLLVLTEAGRHFARQNIGGDVILISTKNVFAPGAGF